MLTYQADCYKTHESWFKNEESSGEVIRASVLSFRAKKLDKDEDFLPVIADITEQRGRSKNP
jgi:hypothetical protein